MPIPALALLAPTLLGGCLPKVAESTWNDHLVVLAALEPPAAGIGNSPQLDDGTIGVAAEPHGTDHGSVFVNVVAGVSTEAFAMSAFRAFRDSGSEEFVVDNATPPDLAVVYDQHITTTKCKSTMDSCGAKDSYTYGALPAASSFPATVPAGAEVREYTVYNRLVTSCNGTPSETLVVRGWMYRERGIVNTQEKWTQHWFLHNSSASAPYALPDACEPINGQQIDLVVRLTEIKDSNGNPVTTARSLRAAVAELTSACSGQETGCGVCVSSTCDYAQLVLDWWKFQ